MLIQMGAHGMRTKRLRSKSEPSPLGGRWLVASRRRITHRTAVRLLTDEGTLPRWGFVPFGLKCDSDSLLAGSGLHQIDFDLVQRHDAYALTWKSSADIFCLWKSEDKVYLPRQMLFSLKETLNLNVLSRLGSILLDVCYLSRLKFAPQISTSPHLS